MFLCKECVVPFGERSKIFVIITLPYPIPQYPNPPIPQSPIQWDTMKGLEQPNDGPTDKGADNHTNKQTNKNCDI